MVEKIGTYLVNITILEGRHYAWPEMDSYVHVKIGNQKHCTKVAKSNDCPYYNEYFVFEFKTDLQTLIDKTISLMVIRPKTCWRRKKILGYCTLEIATVWSQPDHLFFQKWAILSCSAPEYAGPRGYLKVTLCITTKGQQAKIPLTNPNINDEIEGNLLIPDGITLERQRALFIFKVFKGDGIVRYRPPVMENLKPLPTNNKHLPNSVIEITFAGVTVSTSTQKQTQKPIWNEMLTIAELFPPLCQRVKMILKISNSSLRSVKYFNLYSIANDQEHGFLPTFGPTYVHFYSTDAFGDIYVGKVLMSLHTQLQNEQVTQFKQTIKRPIMPVNENTLYKYEPTLLFFAILNVNAIDKRFSKKAIHFEISVGNSRQYVSATEGDGTPLNITPAFIPRRADQTYWYLDFENQVQCLSFQNSFPDLRRRFYNGNMIEKLCTNLKAHLDEIEPLFEYERLQIPSIIIETKLTETLDSLANGCRKYIDMVKPTLDQYVTELDKEKLKLCIREMEEIEDKAKTIYNTKAKKKSYRKTQKLYKRLSLLIEHPQDCWPDIIINMIYKNKKVSTILYESEHVTFSMVDEEAGDMCGKPQHLFFESPLKLRSIDKSTTACVMNVIMWLGIRRHLDFCLHSLPDCFRFEGQGLSTIPRYMINPEKHIFQCRAHIYQGNFQYGIDVSGLADPFVRVMYNKSSACTKIQRNVLNPLWNETITFTNIIVYGSNSYIKSEPPPIIVEAVDSDQRCKNDLIGRVIIRPSIKLKEQPYTQPEFPPKLKWYSVKKKNVVFGEILACVEFLEITDFGDETPTEDRTHVVPIPEDIRPKLSGYKIDILFWGLRHLKKIHRISISKPRITLDCTMAGIDSDVLTKNELNFPIYQKELIVDLPEDDKYIPFISFKLFDSRSFGRFTYVGNHSTHVHHYVCYPLTKEERHVKLTESVHKSYDSMDSQIASIHENIPPVIKQKPKPKTLKQIASDISSKSRYKVENEVVGCCACCKKLRKKKKKQKEAERKLSAATISDVMHEILKEDDFSDWWNKYFSSLKPATSAYDDVLENRTTSKKFRLKIYNDELEHRIEFSYLQDTLVPFPIIRGENIGDEDVDEKNIMGLFKGNLRIYPWPPHKNAEYVTPSGLPIKDGYFQDYPSNENVSFVARVYCVKGIKLRPKDMGGKSDPFLVAFMGNQHFNESKNYVPNNINPIFGKCFEFNGTFPFDTVVTIQVWDWDRNSKHDLIGETKIDLENRFYTKHRACCGLPYEYTEIGYTAWRDIEKPTEILESLCKRGNLPKPEYFDTYVRIGNFMFAPTVEDGEKPKTFYNQEDLALIVLHRWQEIPVVGCYLVPEHVEARSLYNSYSQPGIEQGKLQLWVDVFPISDLPPPRAVDITPTVPQKYELRVTIWNTEDVLLEEDDFFVGEKKCDIFVKGWLAAPDKVQSTDVHYRSLSGEGNFNWRFVFPFSYLKTEHKIVHMKKERFTDLVPTEQKIPCQLKLQVWDNDTFSPNDFLGSLSLDLKRMPRGARSANKCSLNILEPDAPHINLFVVRRTKGWWPFRGVDDKNEYTLTGKLEAEFQLLTDEEAEANPAGLGRKEPNPLPKPNRPDTSFSFFKNPLKLLKYLICKHYKWRIIRCLLFLFLCAMIGLAIWAFPGYTVKKILRV